MTGVLLMLCPCRAGVRRCVFRVGDHLGGQVRVLGSLRPVHRPGACGDLPGHHPGEQHGLHRHHQVLQRYVPRAANLSSTVISGH